MILNKVKFCKYYNFVIYICFPLETVTLLQCRCKSLSDLALKFPYSCDGNIRRCKNDVVATSHYDVF